MHKHVGKLLSAQRDILAPQAIAAIQAAMLELKKTMAAPISKKELLDEMKRLEDAANKWLKPYPNAGFRENVEVLLVAIAVAMAIRTFFLQPFKIPTGSIWFNGVQYKEKFAQADGEISNRDDTPQRFLLFNLKQSFWINGVKHTVWFPPDDLWKRAGVDTYGTTKVYKKGDPVIRLRTVSGDHLFVDRLTYNFRRPQRGEIIVFETDGIERMARNQWGQFYIKRLVALGGEHVRISDDRHLIINDTKLTAATPHFENVYSKEALSRPPEDSQYSGHVNGTIARQYSPYDLCPLFPDESHEFVVQPNHYMVMGDNTMNSSDSRTWGDFPREKVIGKAFCIYWPIGPQNGRPSRFGFGYR